MDLAYAFPIQASAIGSDELVGASTSQGKCAYVLWTWLMLFQFKLLRSVVASAKEVQGVFLSRRK